MFPARYVYRLRLPGARPFLAKWRQHACVCLEGLLLVYWAAMLVALVFEQQVGLYA